LKFPNLNCVYKWKHFYELFIYLLDNKKNENKMSLNRIVQSSLLNSKLVLNRGTASILIANYHEKVIDHYENPRNVGSFDKKLTDVGTGLVGAPACGDVMKLQVSYSVLIKFLNTNNYNNNNKKDKSR
jgi:hypothetical protein